MTPCKDRQSGIDTFNTFFKITSKSGRENWLTACPPPCKQKSYNIKIVPYHRNSLVDATFTYEKTLGEPFIYLSLYYDSLGIIEQDETLLYDVGSFLSAAGGNLGLLLGFSCLSVFIGIFKLLKLKKIKSLYSKWIRK